MTEDMRKIVEALNARQVQVATALDGAKLPNDRMTATALMTLALYKMVKDRGTAEVAKLLADMASAMGYRQQAEANDVLANFKPKTIH